MELDLFSMKCNEVSSSEFWVSIGLAWLWEACLLMPGAVFQYCWRISLVFLALDLFGSWVELLSINVPWNQVFSDVLKFLS